jgi:hypothetical protein
MFAVILSEIRIYQLCVDDANRRLAEKAQRLAAHWTVRVKGPDHPTRRGVLAFFAVFLHT